MLQNCDSIRDTIKVQKGLYWYPISTEPNMKSLKVHFDGFNSVMDEEYFISVIKSKDSCEFYDTTNHWVPYDSDEAIMYAPILIGEKIFKNNQMIEITEDNYMDHLDLLEGRFFINFSDSNQIKSIIDTDGVDSFTITYWRGTIPDMEPIEALKIEHESNSYILTDPDHSFIRVDKG